MSCSSGKIAYATRSEAEAARRAIRGRPRYTKGDGERTSCIQVFHCTCGTFHLGRDKRSGRPQRIRVSIEDKRRRHRELTEDAQP